MTNITPQEAFFRIFAGLFLFYALYQANETIQAIELLGISREQKLWYAAWLHIATHLSISVSCLLIILRVRWGLWLLVLVVVTSKAIGALTLLDNGVVSLISIVPIVALVYTMIFLKEYLKPWKKAA